MEIEKKYTCTNDFAVKTNITRLHDFEVDNIISTYVELLYLFRALGFRPLDIRLLSRRHRDIGGVEVEQMTERNPLMREWLEKPRRIKDRYSQKTCIIARRARINGEDRTRYARTIAKTATDGSVIFLLSSLVWYPLNSSAFLDFDG
jgi:hypothetical protein